MRSRWATRAITGMADSEGFGILTCPVCDFSTCLSFCKWLYISRVCCPKCTKIKTTHNSRKARMFHQNCGLASCLVRIPPISVHRECDVSGPSPFPNQASVRLCDVQPPSSTRPRHHTLPLRPLHRPADIAPLMPPVSCVLP